VNQSSQNTFVASKSTFHTYFIEPFSALIALTYSGIEIRADSRFLTVPDFIAHLITESRPLNYCGLALTMFSINGRAYNAVPSTTSITTSP